PSSTAIYTLSLHDALPILATKYEADLEGYHAYKEYLDQARSQKAEELLQLGMGEDQIKETLDKFGFEQEKAEAQKIGEQVRNAKDRKSTRLNSSHVKISYA